MKKHTTLLIPVMVISVLIPCTQSHAIMTACNTLNCKSSDWTTLPNAGEGVIWRTYRYCENTTTCKSVTQYGCNAGYYGQPTDATSDECKKCPGDGTSSLPQLTVVGINNTEITDCYIPTGTEMSDSTGTYTYTQNCYYTE